MKIIENGLSSVSDIYRKLKENDNSKTTEKKLGDILDRLEVLNLSDFSSSEEETKIIKKIQDVVINKFVRLINEDNAVNLTKKAYPKTIKEAFALESTDLQNIILETLRNRPNMTCIADRLPGFVISYLGIITRGEPRIKFETIVKREINQLLEISVLHKYSTDSNTRYRLLG